MTAIERLIELLENQKWTMYQLSKKSGISQSTISNLIRRGQQPSLYTLSKICAALGMNLSQFFDYDESHPREVLTYEQKIVLEKWTSLSPEQQEKVRKFIAELLINKNN